MLPQFSVKKPYTIVVAVVIIAILGVVSLTNMTTDLLPSMNLPYTVITTTYVGASPEEVEQVVTRPIEQSMATLSNINNVRSVSSENISIVILEFSGSANMDSAIIEMRENLDMVTAYMPDAVGSPMIIKLNPDMMPVMVLSAAVEGQSLSESSSFLESRIVPELESVEGVASVQTSGLVENQVHVIIREEKIEEVNETIRKTIAASAGQFTHQLPPMDIPAVTISREMVTGILAGQNFSMPAGYIIEDGVDYLVRTGEEIKSLDELRQLPVMVLPLEGMEPVVLEDIAEIVVMDSSGESYTRFNGEEAIMLMVQKQTDYSTAGVAGDVRSKIDDLMARHEGLAVISLMDQGEYVDMVVGSIGSNLIIGGALAILILLLFLRDLKPTIVTGIAIPVSLVAAITMMYFSGVSLNIISMGGLALGVGMLVDNSIVVIENIYRMRSEGKGAREAAVMGAREVAGAITASTLTTVSVFLPIVFTQGMARQIFTDMGLTIAYALLASLVVSLTLVPMIASNFKQKEQGRHKTNSLDRVKAGYTRVLKYSLNHRWIVILTAVVLFAGSITGAFTMGTEFFPASDTGQIMVNVSLPEETTFEDAAARADEVVEIISAIDGVDTVGAMMGGGGRMGMGFMGGGGSDHSSVSLYILLDDDRKSTTNRIAQVIRDNTAGVEAEITVRDSDMDMAAFSGGTIAVNIMGRDLDVLQSMAADVAGTIAEVEGTIEVSDGLGRTSPELRIVVDKEKSIAQGLTVAQVFREVNRALQQNGVATTLSIGAADYDILVDDEFSLSGMNREDLGNLIIETPQGEKVVLQDIATLEEGTGFSSINRTNQQRYVTVTAGLAEGYNIGLVSREIDNKLASYEVPDGYSLHTGGEQEMIGDAFRDLFLMLALGVIFIYLVMVAQFQSLLSPFIVMFTIPLAFTGGFMGLMLTGNPVSVVAFIGLIILSGVVVNNGIVFVDYINKLRDTGMTKREAIVRAGNVRLRPIIMTALTTVIALSTMSLGVGMGTEMIQPMAITAIGGLIYATLLTLLLVPVLYDAFNRKERNAGETAPDSL